MLLFLILCLFHTYALVSNKQLIASSVFDKKNSYYASPFIAKSIGFDIMMYSGYDRAIEYTSLKKRGPIFPKDSASYSWIKSFQIQKRNEIETASLANISIFTMLDIFVFPSRLIQLYHDDIVNSTTKKIDINKPASLSILNVLLNELLYYYPEISGYVIRVGEGGGAYLSSYPYHNGNGAVNFDLSFSKQQDEYVKLIDFLINKICIQNNKYLIIRTWDTAGFSPHDKGRFHSNINYYLNVTNRIQPHSLLYFSIKHTTTDFWRWQDWNPTLGIGHHAQILEVQAAREYEGKGAYLSYIGDGVINGFEEQLTIKRKGKYGLIHDIRKNKLLRGLWMWSKGGGWYGPYTDSSEYLIMANIYVISQFYIQYQMANITEEDIFHSFCDSISISYSSCTLLHSVYLLSATINLKMHYCEAYDRLLEGRHLPTANWMRDDRLGGLKQLCPVFSFLYKNNKFSEAIKEKEKAVSMISDMIKIISSIPFDISSSQFMAEHYTGSYYLLYLANIILNGWKVLSIGYIGDSTGVYDMKALNASIISYDNSWNSYNAFSISAYRCGSLYYGKYLNEEGLDYSVNQYRNITK